MNFKNKTIIITGGTGGIGKSIVEQFCDAGANIILTGTKKIIVKNFFSKAYKNSIQYHLLDFSSKDSINKFIDFLDTTNKVDILINNAGVNKIDLINNIPTQDWDWINSVNLRGPFLLTKAISKKMINQKSGKIINVASIFGVVSKEKRAAYSSTKWGLIGFTKAVAIELAPYNIQVNAISPGFVNTKLTRRILGDKNIKKITKTIPTGRLASVDEISKVVLFLCSDDSSYITGQNIIVDGGYTSA